MKFHRYVPNILLLAVASLLSNDQNSVVASDHFEYGFQSGRQKNDKGGAADANSYAGSMYYDASNNLLFITGSTYWSYWERAGQTLQDASQATYLDNSDCFLAVLEIPRSLPRSPPKKNMSIMYSTGFGVANYQETCSAITMSTHGGQTKVIAAGHTEEQGFLTSLRPLGSPVSTSYGFLMSTHFDIVQNSDIVLDLKRLNDSGFLMNDKKVQYPIAVTTNPNPVDGEPEQAFVVTLSSSSDDRNDYGFTEKYPDFTTGGGFEKPPRGGEHFNIVLHKVNRKSNDEIEYEDNETDLYEGGVKDEGGVKLGLKSSYTEIFSRSRDLSKNDASNTYVRVSDLLYVPYIHPNGRNDKLILTGTTNGNGEGIGGFHDWVASHHAQHHGFVTKLNTDGQIEKSIRIGHGKGTVSIKGVCYGESDNIMNLYIVGETTGHLDTTMKSFEISNDLNGKPSKHAFLAKIDFQTLEHKWTRQIGTLSGNTAVAYSCAVNTEDDMVFMAGTVENGDALRILKKDLLDSQNLVQAESAGGDDVFIVNFDSKNGKTKFVRQFGIADDDSLAKGNGITCDKNGDVIMLGNTKGSMMRWRGDGTLSVDATPPSDVFVVSISKTTGNSRVISEVLGYDDFDVDGDEEIDGGGKVGNFALYGFEIVAIAVASSIIFVALLYAGYKTVELDRTNTRENGERILEYLSDFRHPSVGLHVRHSATGGVHGVYELNKKRNSQGRPPSRVSFDTDSLLPPATSEKQSPKLISNQVKEKYAQLQKEQSLIRANYAILQNKEKKELQKKEKKSVQRNIEPAPSFDGDVTLSSNASFDSVNRFVDAKVAKIQPKTVNVNSTPVFDDQDTEVGMAIDYLDGAYNWTDKRNSTPPGRKDDVALQQPVVPVPPRAAFTIDDENDDVSDDDEWESEIF